MKTVRETILAVRNAELVRDTVNDTRTVTTTRTETRQIGWYDPLAQSFICDEEGGVFLTGVDIFFKTKDANIPISMQIRTMENGYPTKDILPFSDVTINPAQVELSDNAAIPSRFTLNLFSIDSLFSSNKEELLPQDLSNFDLRNTSSLLNANAPPLPAQFII